MTDQREKVQSLHPPDAGVVEVRIKGGSLFERFKRSALEALEAVISTPLTTHGTSLGQEVQAIGTAALDDVKARLDRGRIKNLTQLADIEAKYEATRLAREATRRERLLNDELEERVGLEKEKLRLQRLHLRLQALAALGPVVLQSGDEEAIMFHGQVQAMLQVLEGGAAKASKRLTG